MKQRTLMFVLILLLTASQPVAGRDSLSADSLASPGIPSPAPPAALQLQLSTADASSALAAPSALRSRFDPSLLKGLLAASEQVPLRGIVWMREQARVAQMSFAGMDRLTRREAIVSRLQSVAHDSQRKVRAFLENARQEHRVAAYKPLWIVNAIAVEAKKEVFWELAAHPDVAVILEDHLHYLPKGELRPWMPGDVAQLDGVQWNVARVQADRVWEALGVTGQGVVVANMDSGVDWQHPGLMTRYRGYVGKPWAIHEGNWYCATSEGYTYPGDGLGHGTHTMGIMVGQTGIGVAPGAQWIAAKVFNNQGVAYDSWIHDGFQWILAPGGVPSQAPDVVSNSWGNEISTSEEFLPDVQALRAAGIFAVFAAGNDGPESGSVHSPASYRESFAVGATDNQDLIALFSGRGLSPWGEVKPEVSAPGVGVLSTIPGGAVGVESGTSMAAPHVAGLIALMLEANPTLASEEIESILTQAALPLGDGHPNNTYGWGLVDAYAAVTRAGSFGQLTGQVTDAGDGTAIANARVLAVSREGRATTATDALGRYGVHLSSGSYDVTFAAFGYNTHSARNIVITMGLTATLDVALTALSTGVLNGVVRQATTGTPLKAAVYVPGTPSTTTTSAGSGAYSLILPEGTHTVRVEREAHRYVAATVVIHSGESTYRDFALEPAPTILLVDSGAWYNDSQRPYYEAALDSLRYLYDRHIIANVGLTSTDVPTPSTLLPYDVVIWSAPRDAPGYIGAANAITSYLTSGGRLLLSGQDVAFWDGGGSGVFYEPYLVQYLKTRFVKDDAASRVLVGQGTVFAGITITIAGAGGADNQLFPDVIASADQDYATSVLTYQEDGSGGQTAGPCQPYRAVFLSFGLEAANDAASRQEVLERSIGWLAGPLQPAGVELNVQDMPQIEPAGAWITHSLRLRNTGEVSTDTYALNLIGGAWPTVLQSPPSITLGACQSETMHISVSVPPDAGWHVFDTATLAARSTVSPSLASTVSLISKTPAPVLLVDGARFYRVEGRYRAALEESGIPYDYHRVKEAWPLAIPATHTLAMYPAVVWYTAYDWYLPLSAEEERRLIGYLDGGGRLFLSSQDYLYYGHDNPLAREYLGVLDYSEDLSTTVALGEAIHPVGWGIGPYTLTYPYTNWSDALTLTLNARVALRGQHWLPIGLTLDGDGWRTAFYGFPLETLASSPATTVMARTVGWLSWLGTSTWEAERRTVDSGGQVTMTCVLRNDGWSDIASAHFSATLPAELSLVTGSLGAGATYHPLTRTVTWEGGVTRNDGVTLQLGVEIASSLADSANVSLPVYIGYDDHAISFERPYILRINAPDLSSSSLIAEPAASPPQQMLTYTLTVRNTGVRDATAVITAVLPLHAVFTGTLDSGGIGMGEVVSRTLSWIGPVAAEDEVALRYHLALDNAGGYWLIHRAQVGDQHGEQWHVEARTDVWFWKAYLPLVFKQ